jgi:hypothetical protein
VVQVFVRRCQQAAAKPPRFQEMFDDLEQS